MGVEIEHKFLVQGDSWRRQADKGVHIQQGYLAEGTETTVRVRQAGDLAYLTIKGPSAGAARLEYEYPIPLADALEILQQLCLGPRIDKTRYTLHVADVEWVVDEFHGANDGLILAEIELSHEGQPFERPDWVGADVTDDPRYYNVALSRHPYSHWNRP